MIINFQLDVILNVGIIDKPVDSIFTYSQFGGWNTYYKPDYNPLFEAKFDNLELEEEALQVSKLLLLHNYGSLRSCVMMTSSVYLILLLLVI